MKKLELKIPPLLVMIFFIILMSVVSRIDPLAFRGSLTISITFLIMGIVVCFCSVMLFKRNRTTVNPLCPDESNTLVIQGIYKFSRNPMYLSFYTWILSYGFFIGSTTSIILSLFFILYMNIFQIIPEERILENKFGESYLQYKSDVRRWI